MNRPVSARDDALPHAIEVFVRGFSFTRSFTHPYVAERIGPAWVMRDGPRTSGAARNEEWVAHGVLPPELDRLARRHAQGRFALCAIVGAGESDTTLRAGYKALGYRLNATEAFMVHPLRRIPRFVSPAIIERVTTRSRSDQLARAAQRRQILPEHLADRRTAPLRAYIALVDNQIVGWVRSVRAGDATWCSNMYVAPAFRRRGIGRALLSAMLRDDRATGARRSVLLASHTGALLYPLLGYPTIGTLLLYTPARRTR